METGSCIDIQKSELKPKVAYGSNKLNFAPSLATSGSASFVSYRNIDIAPKTKYTCLLKLYLLKASIQALLPE